MYEGPVDSQDASLHAPFQSEPEAPHDPTRRGYVLTYRENEVNRCPGCSRTHWYVGRLSAECGFCGTALPLQESLSGPGRRSRAA